MLHVIDVQSAKLTRLIIQLLDVSRLENETITLERSTVDLFALVASVVASERLRETGHAITMHGRPGVMASVDAVRFEQIMTNLVDNAISYSPERGAIDIDVATGAGQAYVAVRDRGIGIPPEHRAGIFDRFYRAHPASQYGGLGLGLYITHQLITLHGGAITVEFPSDGGTKFIVTLPLTAPS